MRQEKTITLNDRGRDLVFRVKEMSAMSLQRWLINLAGVVVGKSDMKALVAELKHGGLSMIQGLNADAIQPLIDELLACCYYVNGKTAVQVTATTVDGIIEDVRTLFQLEAEAAAVNLSFFDTDSLSAIRQAATDLIAPQSQKQSISLRS